MIVAGNDPLASNLAGADRSQEWPWHQTPICWNDRHVDRLAAELMGGIVHDGVGSFPDFRVQVNETQILAETVITRATFSGTHGGEL